MLLSTPEVAFHMRGLTDDKDLPCVAGMLPVSGQRGILHAAQAARGFGCLHDMSKRAGVLQLSKHRLTLQIWDFPGPN